MGKGKEPPFATLPKYLCTHQAGSSLNHVLWVFMDVSLHKDD